MNLTTRVVPIGLRMVSPLVTGHGTVGVRRGLIVALDDGELTGWGEASPLPGWSRDTLDETHEALRSAAAAVERNGDVPTALAELRDRPYARAAMAGAWADLRAKQDGLPLATWLAPERLAEVPVNAVVEAASVEAVEAAVAAARADGCTTVKLKVGIGDRANDVERVRAVRRVGPEVAIRLDANQAWDRDTAIDVLRSVATEEIAWCEEPTALVDDFRAIEAATGVVIAADESVAGETELRLALDRGVSVVVVKPQAIGGPDRARDFAGLIGDSGGTLVVTSFMDSAVGVAHALHVAAAFGGPVAHGLATSGLLADDVGPTVPVEAGMMRLPSAPGIGFDPSV